MDIQHTLTKNSTILALPAIGQLRVENKTASWRALAERYGVSFSKIDTLRKLTVTDPGAHPWDIDAMPGESPEARAFRRYPIAVHKPGPG